MGFQEFLKTFWTGKNFPVVQQFLGMKHLQMLGETHISIEDGGAVTMVLIIKPVRIILTLLRSSFKPWPNGVSSYHKLKTCSNCDSVWL